jgi:putative hydrolase of the HAD superfamily
MNPIELLSLPPVIFFDLDDTIIYFDKAGEGVWQKVCTDFASRDSRIDAEMLVKSINRVSSWFWRDPDRHRIGRLKLDETRKDLVTLALEVMGICDEELASDITAEYVTIREELIHLVPGAFETLEMLSSRSRLALITNGESHKQRWKIERFNLGSFFEQIFIEEEMGFGKPDLRAYELALSVMNAKAHETWMIGDNLEWDIAAPQKLGIFAVWNDWRGKGLDPNASVRPDRIIGSIAELV